MADVKSDRRQALELAITAIDRQFGKGAIMRLGAAAGRSTRSRSSQRARSRSTSRSASAAFPRGRVIEIYGPESSGKTTLALHVIAEAQKHGRHRRLHRCRARPRSRSTPRSSASTSTSC